MSELLEVAKKLSAGKHHATRNDDVFIDRLNHRYTVSMILVFAAIITTQQYFGSPITCWVPAQFTSGYEKYANDICWIMNTYYIPMDNDIPHPEPTRYERTLKYYQWSPFILLFMAFCFYFPRMLWRSLNNRSGLDIEKLVDMVMKQMDVEKAEEKSDKDEGTGEKPAAKDSKAEAKSEKPAESVAKLMQVYLDSHYNSSNRGPGRPKSSVQKFFYYLTFWRHRHLTAYIIVLFTFVKLLFLLNSLVQIFFLNAFLGNEYHLFGFEVIVKFLRGLDWGESKRFPRVTLCDFHIREVGIVHRYTVQCVLPINLFNEKIFLILWFWILILGAFNAGDFIAWLFRIVRVDSRTGYVKRKLSMAVRSKDGASEYPKSDQGKRDEDDAIKSFVTNYLQEDGCFALRLLARNGQDLIVGDVIYILYDAYLKKHQSKRQNHDGHRIHSNGSSLNTYHTTAYQHIPGRRIIDVLPDSNESQRLMETTS